MIAPKELQPGSSEPGSSNEIDHLLTFVPELSFLPCFEPCIPRLDDAVATHAAVDAHFVGPRLDHVVAGLVELGKQASDENNGGITFLVRTMLHFVQVQPVPASQHPLLVALYLRGTARAKGREDSARAIAHAMDQWA